MDAFGELSAVASCMGGFERPWFVVGGWAIDLYLGRVTREHEDVDIGIFRADQLHLQGYLRDWQLEKASPGVPGVLEPWREGERLELPVHEIHAHRESGNPSRIEVLFNEASEGEWRFRKKLEITRPLSLALMRSEAGILFLSPEIVLLYKARQLYRDAHPQGAIHNRFGNGTLDREHTLQPWAAVAEDAGQEMYDRHKDKAEGDFNNVRGALDEERRSWLRQAIENCYPGHPWLDEL